MRNVKVRRKVKVGKLNSNEAGKTGKKNQGGRRKVKVDRSSSNEAGGKGELCQGEKESKGRQVH